MSNKLIGVISNEGELGGVIEDDNFSVNVQITESGPRGLPGPPGTTTWGGITDKPTNLETVEGSQAKADAVLSNAKDYTDQEISSIDMPDPTWESIQNKPSTYAPSEHVHSIGNITGLQNELNSKETPSGSQSKADVAESNAKSYTDSELANFEGMVEHGNDYHTVPYAKESELTTHLADDVSQREIHGLRVNNEKLEYYTGTEWKIASGGIPVGNVSGLSVEEDDAEITLMWTDPDDRYLDDLKIAEWQGTKIIRKEGSYPVSDDDGVLVVDNKTRNHYATNGYKDTGLTNHTTYYYMAFPYTEDAITVDGANRVSATPTDGDDSSGSPGSPNLIAGTMQQGYFGTVPASQLFTGTQLSSAVGISEGTIQFDDTPWLKFALDGKILFRPMKAFRHSISWNTINGVGCVFGTKTVTKNGHTYKVRLMKGALTDPSLYDAPDMGAKGSEWNKLMLPIHIQAKDKSWAHPAYVEDNIPYWGIDFTDQDLHTHSNLGNGAYVWCQETRNTNTSYRVSRGNVGVSYSYSLYTAYALANHV